MTLGDRLGADGNDVAVPHAGVVALPKLLLIAIQL